jgi:hypothetical protein
MNREERKRLLRERVKVVNPLQSKTLRRKPSIRVSSMPAQPTAPPTGSFSLGEIMAVRKEKWLKERDCFAEELLPFKRRQDSLALMRIAFQQYPLGVPF